MNLATFNLGESYVYRDSVSNLSGEYFWNTILLTGTAAVIAKEKGVDMVLDSNMAIYVGPNVTDLTDVLVTRYNSK